MRRLIILRSASGAGKSTFADLLAEFPDSVICTADDYFMEGGEYKFRPQDLKAAHEACREKATLAMSRKTSLVVIANTNCGEWEFAAYEEIAANYDYMVTHLIVENRHGNKSIHGVPDEVVENQKEKLLNSIKL